MDATEFERRVRVLGGGWVPPHLVALLLEHGRTDLVRERADAGDWFCAKAIARSLADEGRRETAEATIAPFVAAHRWSAAREFAALLEERGDVAAAVDLVRRQTGDRLALDHLARLLARAGRGDEAVDLLRPHLGDWLLAEALVESSAGLGRDEEIAELLLPLLPDARHPGGRSAEPCNAIDLLAEVRERQGRTDEAIALLRTRDIRAVNDRDRLADLLVAPGRLDELREYLEGDDRAVAARSLVEHLESTGDVEGAVDALRPIADRHSPHAAIMLAELLARHGREDEAVAVLRPAPGAMIDPVDWVLRTVWTLLVGLGRVEEALAAVDEAADRAGDMSPFELFCERAWALSLAGRAGQALTELAARSESGTSSGRLLHADLLVAAGRADEAIALLEPARGTPGVPDRLARLLIEDGRAEEAVALLAAPPPEPPRDPSVDGPWLRALQRLTLVTRLR